jgi:folate-dependent phosphoribosylglycinamide formyltransferase PurN
MYKRHIQLAIEAALNYSEETGLTLHNVRDEVDDGYLKVSFTADVVDEADGKRRPHRFIATRGRVEKTWSLA